jgi:hypothetical protein
LEKKSCDINTKKATCEQLFMEVFQENHQFLAVKVNWKELAESRKTMRQSYDFKIYNYNASVFVG